MATIFRARGEAFRRSHVLSPEQKKALWALEHCRTEVLGGHVSLCVDCGAREISYNSCRNRHCPKCQSLSQAKWIEQRLQRLLPVNYFHVVFTLPRALREFARRSPKEIYDLLFAAASKTLLELGRDPKRLGAQLGITAVLHTWTRRLELHPHLHCIVTGGGLTSDGRRWATVPGKDRFLFPVKVLSKLFRGKFLAGLARLFDDEKLGVDPNDPIENAAFAALKKKLFAHDWVVYAKRPFAGAEHVYRYLGRYTHRVGVSNHRLLAITAEDVTFATRGGHSETLRHDEFIRRFLLHVLPPHFTKIRHFGLMASSNATTKLEVARRLLDGTTRSQGEPEAWLDFYERLTGHDLRRCVKCGGPVLRMDIYAHQLAMRVFAHREGKGPDP